MIETQEVGGSGAAEAPDVGSPVASLAARIRDWLHDASGAAQDGPLIGWLQGYGLPRVGHDEPYVWLAEAYEHLAEGDDREEFRNRLANVLDSRPDVERPGRRPEELLYNLLLLCTRIEDRRKLGPPLLRMYDRADGDSGLKGLQWSGLDLRKPLSSALIVNQPFRTATTGERDLDETIRPRLEAAWFRLLESHEDDALPVTEAYGFSGVLTLDEPGSPNLPALGRAVDATVKAGPEAEGRPRDEFRDRLARILDRHPSRSEELINFFLLQARTSRWEDWARRGLAWPGDPSWSSIGRALTNLAEQLNPQRKVRCKMMHDYCKAALTFGGTEDQLIEIVHEGGWREWAVDCLPCLWIEPEQGHIPSHRWIVWHPLWLYLQKFATLKKLRADPEQILCQRRVVVGVMDDRVAEFGRRIVDVFEKNRLDFRLTDPLRGDIATRYASTVCAKMPEFEGDPAVRALFTERRTLTTHKIQLSRQSQGCLV